MPEPTVMLGFALRAAVVLFFAWLLTFSMRRASAAARHLAWTCAIAAAALLPVVASVAPDWRVTSPMLDAVPLPRATTVPAFTPSTSRERTLAAGADDHWAPRPELASLDEGTLGLIVWAAGTLGVSVYVAVGFLGAWLLRRSGQFGGTWCDEARALAETFDIPRPVRVLTCRASATPVVCGIWRPTILLPSSAASWTEQRRHVVLLHELAHVKRHDCLTQLLAQIVCALYWFNPLVWIAARRLRTERERACDDFVLAAGAQGSEYADHLLEIALSTQPAGLSPVAGVVVAMARRTQLEGRLMAILSPTVRRTSTLSARLVAAFAVIVVSVPVAAIQLTGPSEPGSGGAIDDRVRQTLNRALVEYAQDGDVDGVNAMLAAGADVDARIAGDGSPLIAAAGDGHIDLVQLLLDKRADPNLIVPGDGTALIAAAADGHTAVVALLLQRGADVNLIAEGDETALIQASGDGHLDVVKLLVSRGADVNLGVLADRWIRDDRDPSGAVRHRQSELRTPLGQAKADGHVDVVQFLISAGARD